MQEKVKGVWEKVRAFFTKMNKKTRIVLGAVLSAVLVIALVAAVALNSREYPVLFTGLTSDEMSSIVTYLSEQGVTDYKIEGDTLRVPPGQENKLAADLAMQGYPKSGFLYGTYWEHINGMSTESDKAIASKQDLEVRLASVVRCFDGVHDAAVTITQGEDRRYVLDSDNITEATAAVMVTMEGNAKLTDKQVSGIRNMVARSVKDLDFGNVQVTDGEGTPYTSSDGIQGASDASALKLQLEDLMNGRIRDQILLAISPLYGPENVKVAVNTTVDVDHRVGETFDVTLPPWAADGSTGGEGIIGSKIYDQELIRNADGTVGNVVGNDANAEIPTYVETNNGLNDNNDYIKNQGETVYTNPTETTQHERVAGYVSDLMVSVSINSTVAGNVNTTELLNHVAHAAGIANDMQTEKVSILLAPFYDPNAGIVPAPEFALPPWTVYAAIGGAVLLLMLLLVIATLRKKKKKKKLAALKAVMDQNAVPIPDIAIPPDAGADIMNIKTEKSIQLRQEIRKFAEETPELAAQMLKSWMKGGEDDG